MEFALALIGPNVWIIEQILAYQGGNCSVTVSQLVRFLKYHVSIPIYYYWPFFSVYNTKLLL